jgi:enoyl-[acyl-carrier-protein] reductase (NADH)
MAAPFEGKRALVLGVANKRSIAWAIAQRLADGGARLAFTYQGERIQKSVADLAATVDTALVTECDVRSDDDVTRVFGEVGDAFGGERVVPHYNVMGVAKATLDASMRYLASDLGEKNIRVNAISAGPVRTLAARSIAGFPTMEAIVEERAPLHRPIDADDVAAGAAYLLGDGAKNVTGTTLYVDSGYHAMGM